MHAHEREREREREREYNLLFKKIASKLRLRKTNHFLFLNPKNNL